MAPLSQKLKRLRSEAATIRHNHRTAHRGRSHCDCVVRHEQLRQRFIELTATRDRASFLAGLVRDSIVQSTLRRPNERLRAVDRAAHPTHR